jgi:large subunit ribosomal protein L11
MAKPVKMVIKLQIPGGQCTPAPPVGPALGQHGVNIGEFVRQFNDRTKQESGTLLPVIISVYIDQTFSFEVKSPPASYLLKEAAGLAKGSGTTGREQVGKVTKEAVRKIAERKMADLNTKDIDAACKIIAGTARSMGIEVEGM